MVLKNASLLMRGDSFNAFSLIFQNAPGMELCRIWHQLVAAVAEVSRAGPSTSLDERVDKKAYP